MESARPLTPEPSDEPPLDPQTPHTLRAIRALDSQVRRGKISPGKAFRKVQKGFEQWLTEATLMRKEKEEREGAETLDREVRGNGKRSKFTEGFLFDQKWVENHPEAIAEMKGKAKEKEQPKKPRGTSRRKVGLSKVFNAVAGPSGTQHKEMG